MDGDTLAPRVVFAGLNPGLRTHTPTRHPPSALLDVCGSASSHTSDGMNFSQGKPGPMMCMDIFIVGFHFSAGKQLSSAVPYTQEMLRTKVG